MYIYQHLAVALALPIASLFPLVDATAQDTGAGAPSSSSVENEEQKGKENTAGSHRFDDPDTAGLEREELEYDHPDYRGPAEKDDHSYDDRDYVGVEREDLKYDHPDYQGPAEEEDHTFDARDLVGLEREDLRYDHPDYQPQEEEPAKGVYPLGAAAAGVAIDGTSTSEGDAEEDPAEDATENTAASGGAGTDEAPAKPDREAGAAE